MNLFIASEVRSGSTYVAESLAYSFSSSYNVDFWDAGKELFSGLNDYSSGMEIMQLLSKIGQNSLGMRCAKIMCSSLSIICREAKKDPVLQEIFFGEDARWIVIRRKDRIKQAVSLATALASNNWHYYSDPESAPDHQTSVASSAVYDALKMVVLSDDYLENFSRVVARGTVIFYEDFVQNELTSLKEVIEKLALPLDASALILGEPKLQQTAKVAKKVSEEAFRRYFLENYHKIVEE